MKQPTTGHPLRDAATSLAAGLARRIEWRDADPAGVPVDQALQRRVLAGYAEELAALKPEEAVHWLLRRVALLEARLLSVQAAQWHGGVTSTSYPAPAPSPPPETPTVAPEPTIAPVVAEEVVLPTQAVAVFDDALVREGFYRPEKSVSGGAFCWLGPTPKAAVFIPKLKAPVEVRLSILSTLVPDALEKTQVALDGGEWTTVTVLRTDGQITLVATPPPGKQAQATTMRLDIDAIRTDSPKKHGGTDGRQLSIALRQIEVRTI